MHGVGFDSWNMAWGGWWTLLFWIGVIALVVWGLRWLVAGSQSADEARKPLTAREIAARRYAQGELSREEFLALIDDLDSLDEQPQKAKRSEQA